MNCTAIVCILLGSSIAFAEEAAECSAAGGACGDVTSLMQMQMKVNKHIQTEETYACLSHLLDGIDPKKGRNIFDRAISKFKASSDHDLDLIDATQDPAAPASTPAPASTGPVSKTVFEGAIGKFKNSIDVDLKEGIKKDIEDLKTEVRQAHDAFAICTDRLTAANSSLAPLETTLSSKQGTHDSCKQEEESKQKIWLVCDEQKKAKQEEKDSCKVPDSLEEECKMGSGETYKETIDRLAAHYEDLKVQYDRQVAKCTKAADELIAKQKECEQKLTTLTDQKKTCDAAKEAKCLADTQLVDASKAMCTNYETCYQDKKQAYESKKQNAQSKVAKLVQEWKASVKLSCAMDHLRGNEVCKKSSPEVEKCSNMVVEDPPEFKVDFQDIPSQAPCTPHDSTCAQAPAPAPAAA